MSQNSFPNRKQLSRTPPKNRAGISFALMATICVMFMLIFFSLPVSVCAAPLIYDGDGAKLKVAPGWVGALDDLNFYPGTEEAPLASGNSIIIEYDPQEPGMTDPGLVMGGLSERGTAEGNTVEMRNGNVATLVGGFSRDGGANGNTVTISGGSAENVYGSAVWNYREDFPAQSSASLNASGNTVVLGNGVRIADSVYGSLTTSYAENSGLATANAAASANKTDIDGSTIGDSAFGGNAKSLAYGDGGDAEAKAEASANDVNINDSTIEYDVFGGAASASAYSEEDDAEAEAMSSGNTVKINGGNTDTTSSGAAVAMAEGDSAFAAAVASNNTAVVDSGAVGWGVYGGIVIAEADGDEGDVWAKAVASTNYVNISDSTIEYEVIGGEANSNAENSGSAFASAEASGNKVKISGSIVGKYDENDGYQYGGEVYGGYAYAYADGREMVRAEADASGNTVDISGSTVYRDIFAGYADIFSEGPAETNVTKTASANDNAVSLSKSRVSGDIFAGQARSDIDAKALRNELNVTDSIVDRTLYGGFAESGAYSEAEYNKVSIAGDSIIAGSVIGGSAAVSAVGTTDTTASASYNTVNISGGRIEGDIIGGHATAYADDGNAAAVATYNTVSLSGAADLAESWIYGGYGDALGTVAVLDLSTGNRLQVRNREIAVLGVENFEFYDFYLPDGISASDTMLSVTNDVDMDGSEVAIFLHGGTDLSVGDIVTLINSDGDVSKPLNDGETVSAKLGALITHDFLVYVSDDDTNLYASYEGGGVSRGNKALGNSRLGAMAFLGQGGDLSAWLERYTTSGGVSGSNLTSFGGVLGGSSTYETGSDVEVKGWSLIAGITWDAPVSRNNLQLSVFIEAGWGDYDTDNSYAGTSVKGNGDIDYFGGGLHARYAWLNAEKTTDWYVDGSVKVGKINSDFNSWDLIDQFGRHLGYDFDSTYYGAHIGLGREWKLNEKTTIDVSSKFIWTRLDGDDFTTTTGDRVSFDDVDSYRWRTGFRVTNERTERVFIYGGLYYEYEFDGDAAGRLFGTYSLDKSSLSGGTGIGELGIMFSPSAENDRLTMGIGVQGYVGTREGVSGILKLQYVF